MARDNLLGLLGNGSGQKSLRETLMVRLDLVGAHNNSNYSRPSTNPSSIIGFSHCSHIGQQSWRLESEHALFATTFVTVISNEL